MRKKLKLAVKSRAFGCCEYCLCQENFSPGPFSIEHIIPVAKDGKTVLPNLALSCQGCNNKKYTFTSWVDPVTGKNAPLFNPRKDNRSNHFQWNEDFTLLIGISTVGRATIERLDLNRAEVVNLREVMILAGLHPPELF